MDMNYWNNAQVEARNFYERLASTFVAASAQAKELESVRADVNNLVLRVTALEEENRKLRADLSQTWEYARGVEQERDIIKGQLEQVRENNIVLKRDLDAEKAWTAEQIKTIDGLKSDLNSARGDVGVLTSKLQDEVGMTEYWKERATRFENDKNRLEATVVSLESDARSQADYIAALNTRLDGVRKAIAETVEQTFVPSLVG